MPTCCRTTPSRSCTAEHPWLFERGPPVGRQAGARRRLGVRAARTGARRHEPAGRAGGEARDEGDGAAGAPAAASRPRTKKARAIGAKARAAQDAEAGGEVPAAKAIARRRRRQRRATVASPWRRRVDGARASRSTTSWPTPTFVVDHPVGAVVDGTVDRFSSHGAYVHVERRSATYLSRELGDPPPRSAREVLNLGERRDRSSVLASIPRPRHRRRARRHRAGSRPPTRQRCRRGGGRATGSTNRTRRRGGARVPSAKKAAKKKAPAKRRRRQEEGSGQASKAPAKRKAAAKRKAPAKRKAAAKKKAPAKRKAAAKRRLRPSEGAGKKKARPSARLPKKKATCQAQGSGQEEGCQEAGSGQEALSERPGCADGVRVQPADTADLGPETDDHSLEQVAGLHARRARARRTATPGVRRPVSSCASAIDAATASSTRRRVDQRPGLGRWRAGLVDELVEHVGVADVGAVDEVRREEGVVEGRRTPSAPSVRTTSSGLAARAACWALRRRPERHARLASHSRPIAVEHVREPAAGPNGRPLGGSSGCSS